MNRKIVFFILLLIAMSGILIFFGVKWMVLGDDTKVIIMIKNTSEVNYTDVHLYAISSSQGLSMIFPPGSYLGPQYYTPLIRIFHAYKYPLESVPLSENYYLVGFVDWDLRVWVITFLKGSEGYL